MFEQEPQHPLFALPTERQARAILRNHGERGLGDFLSRRRQAIADAERDPLQFLPPMKSWKLTRRVVRRYRPKLLVLLGGNRSGKSFYCAYHLVLEMLSQDAGSDARFLVGSETERSSIETAQQLVWRFLPPDLKALNGRRDPRRVFSIGYDPKNGFADRILVLPSGVKLLFATYRGDPAEFEGFEFGSREGYGPAWWLDENAPIPWLTMLRRRGEYRPGYGVWSFTPINGITPAIKEAVGTGKILRTKVARILPPNQVLVEGCRPGRVPLVQAGAIQRTRVVYFHSDMTVFGSGGETYGQQVARAVEGKPRDYVLRIFYGFTKDVMGLQFPTFNRNVHVVRERELPAEGTNYLFIDPAGARNWFLLYVRVAPGNPRRLFIWKDWPDCQTYGEWAVPTERKVTQDSRHGWDGDAGPAQMNLGYGVTRYKRLLKELETIPLELGADGEWKAQDPMARRLLDEAMAKGGMKKEEGRMKWGREEVAEVRKRGVVVRYPIQLRKIDPRAAMNPQAAEKGGTNLIELFAAKQEERGQVHEGVDLIPAYTGRGDDNGVTAVHDLLSFDEQQPLCAVVNEPKLYVSDAAQQVMWMFENFTGRGGEDGACKDPADLVRYVAQDDELVHVTPGMFRAKAGYAY